MQHIDKKKNIENNTDNPLGVQPVNKLLVKFAVPSIIAMLVSALYNIVDQFFYRKKRWKPWKCCY